MSISYPRRFRGVIPLVVHGGWARTYTGAGGSSTFAGTPSLALSITSGNTGGALAVCPAGRAMIGNSPGAWDRYDIAARVRFDLGDGASAASVWIGAGADADSAAVLRLTGDGEFTLGSWIGGSFNALEGPTSGTDSGERTGGDLWLRLVREPGYVAAYYGVATVAGELPETWQCVAVSHDLVLLSVSNGGAFLCRVVTTSGVSGGVSVLLLDTACMGTTAMFEPQSMSGPPDGEL